MMLPMDNYLREMNRVGPERTIGVQPCRFVYLSKWQHYLEIL
jgi:hypothetical protein